MQELAFRTAIHVARTGQPSNFCNIATVSEALQIIYSLLSEIRETPHWQRAECTLVQAAECPENPTLLDFAEVALREAVAAEGWSRE